LIDKILKDGLWNTIITEYMTEGSQDYLDECLRQVNDEIRKALEEQEEFISALQGEIKASKQKEKRLRLSEEEILPVISKYFVELGVRIVKERFKNSDKKVSPARELAKAICQLQEGKNG